MAKQQINPLDAELILADIRDYDDRSELVLNENAELSSDEKDSADGFLRRRKDGEPLAYVLKKKEFYGRSFFVDKNVLIPRPETEVAIEYILETCGQLDDCMILDIGTGSGCIAITLWLELISKGKDFDVIASDISDTALSVAAENFQKMKKLEAIENSRGIKFVKANLLKGIEVDVDRPIIVVANLPYVAKNWGWVDYDSLRFEPEVALFADQNGLKKIYELIDQFVEKFDKKINHGRATLVLEMDESQQEDVANYAAKYRLKADKISDYILAIN